MEVIKTIKLFIDGKFPRSESGRSFVVKNSNGKKIARACQSSRKDFRNAVVAAKKGNALWSSMTAFNRSQIFYRMAEMTESRKQELVFLFQNSLNLSIEESTKIVDGAIDTIVYYGGFADKFHQVIGSVNPVAGPYHNFTSPEPVGVVAFVDSNQFDFIRLVDSLCSILTSGNSVIALLGPGCPAILAPLAEILSTSDLPSGTVNLLTGDVSELVETMASHREVRAISSANDEVIPLIKKLGSENMKRVFGQNKGVCELENILNFVEYKTVWHPIGV